MGVSVTETSLPLATSVPAVRINRLPRWFEDWHGWIAATIYLVVIVAYERYPLEHIQSVCSCLNSDPTQWMWSWKWFIYAIGHGHNPLFTDRIWSGQNFSLAGITLSPTAAIAGIPLTALFGTVAAYNLLMVAAPVISGWAAYRLCRYLSGAPWASILAGYTYGFSAYELGHLLGHLNLIYVFVPPMLVLLVVRFINGDFSRRRTVISATILLLIQFGLSTEVLFDMSCIGFVALVVAFGFAHDRRKLIEVAIVLAIAYAVMAAICSYYIYESLQAPAESGGAAPGFPADLLSYFFPTTTFKAFGSRFTGLSGSFITVDQFEQNNYLGLPLVGILLAFIFTGWRRVATRVVALSTLVAFILSLGVLLTISGTQSYHLPFNWLNEHLPFFNETTPSRLGLFVALGAAVGAAMWISWAQGRANTVWRWLVGLVAVAFLLPNSGLPGRINAVQNPSFFTTNMYKKYLKPNEVVMTLPFSQSGDEMLWQADTGMYFKLAGGYLGYPPPDFAVIPLVHVELYTGAPAPGLSDAVPELRNFVRAHHVGAVVIEANNPQNWPESFAAAGFHRAVAGGGVIVYTPPADLKAGT